ncbi:MAG TPA: hypothetical protein VKM55_14920 [Candidatus Lokiarchaeia archaeon]|nr:hypothetical protein [Candidatus Lokiarchaeia archaeon]
MKDRKYMTINNYHVSFGLAIGRCCLVVELFWIFPWFFGTYEALDDPAKLGTILFGSALVIGVIVASIAAAFDRLNIKIVALASGWVLFGASVIAVYASIFAIAVVDRICIVVIGISWMVLLVSANYMVSGLAVEEYSSTEWLREFHVPEIGAAAAFLAFNAWLINSSWSFRYVGVAIASGLLVVAISHANALRVHDVKGLPSTSKQKTRDSILLGAHALLLLVGGALIALAVAAQIKSSNLGSPAFQAFESPLFIDSGFAIALVLVALVIILSFMNESPSKKYTWKRFSFQQIMPVIVISISTACLVGATSLFMGINATGYIDTSSWTAAAGILSALFLASMIVLAHLTRKMFVTLIIGSVLMMTGVIFVPNLQYPQEWMLLAEIYVPGALIPVALGICWIVVARPWKGTAMITGPVSKRQGSMEVPDA